MLIVRLVPRVGVIAVVLRGSGMVSDGADDELLLGPEGVWH